jgi:adenosylmethionine-8-amino-7-oxononanoate aminotransferase
MHLWPAFSRPLDPFSGSPIVFTKGEGCWLTDEQGKRYLDGVGALEAMVAGHGRTRLAEAARRQLETLAFLDVFRYTSRPALELAEKLSGLAPMPDTKVHYTPGGSEAVETAMKVALQYHYLAGHPERRVFVGRHGAYHGVTLAAMSLGSSYYSMRNDIYLPEGLAVSANAGAVDAARFGSGARYSSDAGRIEEKILEVGPDRVAGVVVDPMGTASGVACPDDEDLRELRRVCDRHGVLLIVDEVITAWGHTGRLFASEHSGIVPDMVTVSKGLSSGYMPIGATLVSGAVAAAFTGRDGLFAHGQTYGGHPPSCAVALENIAILEEERLAERAHTVGPRLIEGIRGLAARQPNLGPVRGRGLLLGLEIMKDAPAGVDFKERPAAGTRFRLALRDAGLIGICVHPGNVLLLAPPLIISEDEIDTMISMIDQGLSALSRLQLD